MSLRPPMRLPDVLVGLACVLLVVGLGGLALSQNRYESRANAIVPAQLRSIHQGLLIYGVDNNRYLPGLDSAGELLTNQPAARFQMLIDAGYATPANLRSPLEKDETVAISYAILDIARPGRRRLAWTSDPVPDAPVLAERQGMKPTLGRWAGWVMYHRATLGAIADPLRYAESPSVLADYGASDGVIGPDNLFEALGPDDAYLIDPAR